MHYEDVSTFSFPDVQLSRKKNCERKVYSLPSAHSENSGQRVRGNHGPERGRVRPAAEMVGVNRRAKLANKLTRYKTCVKCQVKHVNEENTTGRCLNTDSKYYGEASCFITV